MKHISESMPEFRVIKSDKDYDEEKCVVCGTIVKFYENEYKKPCENCGTWVFERKRQANIQSKKIGCWICLDKGVVEYPLQKDGRMYKHIARCSCPKGMIWPGTIPLLEQCQHAPKPEFVELKNRKTYRQLWPVR
jgi:predicted RNA-binding Zn-ribbon protein involved in translation (DUF1610 family)